MKSHLLVPLFVVLLTLAIFPACHKPDPDPSDYVQPTDPYHTLPEITQEGKNTFGCLMNGVVWVPRVEILVPWYTLDFQFSESDDTGTGGIYCRVLSTTQDDFMQVIFGPTFFKTGVYGMSFRNSTDMDFTKNNKDYSAWKRDSFFNFVKVNYINTDLNIVSGQFQFKLFNDANPKDSIKVTDGRFDLHY